MSHHKTQPPWDFLFSASPFTLQSYELSRLNHAANLRKEIASLLDQWMEENASALLARWLLQQRERSVSLRVHIPDPGMEHPSPNAPAGGASDNFFAHGAARRGQS